MFTEDKVIEIYCLADDFRIFLMPSIDLIFHKAEKSVLKGDITVL